MFADALFDGSAGMTHTHTHTSILWPSGLHLGLAMLIGTRTTLDFTEARDSEWQL